MTEGESDEEDEIIEIRVFKKRYIALKNASSVANAKSNFVSIFNMIDNIPVRK